MNECTRTSALRKWISHIGNDMPPLARWGYSAAGHACSTITRMDLKAVRAGCGALVLFVMGAHVAWAAPLQKAAKPGLCPYLCQSVVVYSSEVDGTWVHFCDPKTEELAAAERAHPPHGTAAQQRIHLACEQKRCGTLGYMDSSGEWHSQDRCDASYEEGDIIPGSGRSTVLRDPNFSRDGIGPGYVDPGSARQVFPPGTVWDEFGRPHIPGRSIEVPGLADNVVDFDSFSRWRFDELTREAYDSRYGGRLPPEYVPDVPWGPPGKYTPFYSGGELHMIPSERTFTLPMYPDTQMGTDLSRPPTFSRSPGTSKSAPPEQNVFQRTWDQLRSGFAYLRGLFWQ